MVLCLPREVVDSNLTPTGTGFYKPAESNVSAGSGKLVELASLAYIELTALK